ALLGVRAVRVLVADTGEYTAPLDTNRVDRTFGVFAAPVFGHPAVRHAVTVAVARAARADQAHVEVAVAQLRRVLERAKAQLGRAALVERHAIELDPPLQIPVFDWTRGHGIAVRTDLGVHTVLHRCGRSKLLRSLVPHPKIHHAAV